MEDDFDFTINPTIEDILNDVKKYVNTWKDINSVDQITTFLFNGKVNKTYKVQIKNPKDI